MALNTIILNNIIHHKQLPINSIRYKKLAKHKLIEIKAVHENQFRNFNCLSWRVGVFAP